MSTDPRTGEDPERATTRRMKEAWNLHAEDAYRIIDYRAQSDAELDAFGEEDVASLLADLGPLTPGPDARVLDIGCGIGRLLGPMARRFREVWGVDVSDEMIRLARERLSVFPNVTLSVTNGTDLADLPNDHFDFCCSLYTLESLPDRWIVEAYFREATRVLRTGGILKMQVGGIYARNPFRPAFEEQRGTWSGVRFTLAEIAGVAEAAGFDLMAVYHPHPGMQGHLDWNDPLPQRRIWVVGRKSDGMDDWERVCWRIARTLRETVPPGQRVICPDHRIRWYVASAGAAHVDLLMADRPADGEAAADQLETLRREGAGYLLFSRDTEWWLTAYPEVAAFVRARGREIERTNDLVLFELRS